MQAVADGNSGVAVLEEDAAYAEHLPPRGTATHTHVHMHTYQDGRKKDEKERVVLADLVAQPIVVVRQVSLHSQAAPRAPTGDRCIVGSSACCHRTARALYEVMKRLLLVCVWRMLVIQRTPLSCRTFDWQAAGTHTHTHNAQLYGVEGSPLQFFFWP